MAEVLKRWLATDAPLVIAHRGHSAGAPEQTLAAYRAAVDFGAQMIEADVQRSRDGYLVLMHDATVDRTTSGRGRVADLTFAELRALDAGSWFGPEFSGEVVPSLDELFELADQRGIGLCLEVKGETTRQQELIAELVAEQIVARGRLEQDVLASFDHDVLARVAGATPGLSVAPDRLPERGPSSARALIEQARRARATIIQHHHADLSADIVEAVHGAGVAIWAWPPTSVDEVDRAYALGVDGLMGDDLAVISAAAGRAHAVSGRGTSTPQPRPAEV